MPACSRCGTPDEKHTLECYQAMLLGRQLGVEGATPTRSAPSADRSGEVEALREEIRGLKYALADAQTTVAQFSDQADELHVQLQNEVTGHKATITRLRDQIRELEHDRDAWKANASAMLAAIPEPQPTVVATEWAVPIEVVNEVDGEELPEAAVRAGVRRRPPEPAVEPEPAPAPEQAEERALTPSGHIAPKPGQAWKEAADERRGVPGAWARPETLRAQEGAELFVRSQVVEADPTARRVDDNGNKADYPYLTAPELLAAYEAWAKVTGAPVIPASTRMVGAEATKRFKKRQGPTFGGKKPVVYIGAALRPLEEAKPEPAPEPQAEAPADDEKEQRRRETEEAKAAIEAARTKRVEVVETERRRSKPAPDPAELQAKLAQLKEFGIGGGKGVAREAARTAVASLHPTNRDAWTWAPPADGAPPVSDADLDATTYQLLMRCMDGLPEQYGFDYKEDVLALSGLDREGVEATLRHPQRVEIRPEYANADKRYPILGFHRGDMSVILGMRTPSKPRVIAAYWTSLLGGDQRGNHDPRKVGGGGSKRTTGTPKTPIQAIKILKGRGCEIDEHAEKATDVTYQGQKLGKITCGNAVPRDTVELDYNRILRKMQAIDRRAEVKVG